MRPPPMPTASAATPPAMPKAAATGSPASSAASLLSSSTSPIADPAAEEPPLTPLQWNTCFDNATDVTVPHRRATFRLYDAGLSRLASTPAPASASASPAANALAPVAILLLHGGGHSALSWGLVAARLKAHIPVLAFDARGHGHSVAEQDTLLDAQTQVEDAAAVIRGFFAARFGSTNSGSTTSGTNSHSSSGSHSVSGRNGISSSSGSSSNSSSASGNDNGSSTIVTPKLVVVGHSMGGAIAVRLAAARLLDIVGLVVVDVVEGTALDALPHMMTWLSNRRNSFSTVENAIRYVLRAGHVRNPDSARLSVPSQLTRVTNNTTQAPENNDSATAEIHHPPAALAPTTTADSANDRNDDNTDLCGAHDTVMSGQEKAKKQKKSRRWVWRTPLGITRQYWQGWFEGLSSLFLSVPVAKMLVLASVNRLDKDLMIAQMQGKFQTILITTAGHTIQEDQPEQTAKALLDFLERNMFVTSFDQGKKTTIFQQRGPVPPCP